jgi:putative MATE family efflux protein
MKDLTKGSIPGHILAIAAPVAVSMLAHISYQLIDLYFVTKLGVAATAGVNAAGTAMLVVTALTQVLGVGTAALVAHAVGRKDRRDANSLFNQALLLAATAGATTIAVLYAMRLPYLQWVAADSATLEAGATFTLWVLPGYALLFPFVAVSSALRGSGVVQPPIAIYALTVVLNALLAPVLIAGWGTGVAYGVKGAGLATSLSIAAGLVALSLYFRRLDSYVAVDSELLRPQLKQWGRIVRLGLPAAGEFVLTFLYTALVYYAIRDFGAAAQAGFGIGSRVLQVILLPAIAIAFAAGPIVAQNFGANDGGRVRETFHKATSLSVAAMVITTMILQSRPDLVLSPFDADASTLAVATVFLQLMSWTFVAQGIVYMCSNMFQGLGNTVPSLISSLTRFLVYAPPVLWLSAQPGLRIESLWHLAIATIVLQAIVSLILLQIELRRRLPSTSAPQATNSAIERRVQTTAPSASGATEPS